MNSSELGTTPGVLNRLVIICRHHWQKLVALAFWLALFAIYLAVVLISDKGAIELLLQLIALMRERTWGPLLYLLIFLIRPLTFFSAGVLMITGGYLFGPILGIVYATLGGNLSAVIAFLLGRYFGADLLDSQQSNGLLSRYTTPLRRNSFETVVLMRLLLLPFDLVNYLSGFLRIGFAPFVAGTLLGALPGAIAFTLFGASVDDIELLLLRGQRPSLDWRILAVSALIFGLSFLLSRTFRRRPLA